MLCDRCGKNPPVIHITGEGSYCADCNNQMMLEMFGKDNTFHYAKNIIISETDGKMHSFRIQHLILGGIVSFIWCHNWRWGDYWYTSSCHQRCAALYNCWRHSCQANKKAVLR